MGKIRMKIEVATMELPFLFIDSYMTNCLPVYPLIYIYSYRHAMVGNAVTCQDIEETFELTERDVRKAWKHWETKGLVSIDYSNDDMDVTFLPITIAPQNTKNVVVGEVQIHQTEQVDQISQTDQIEKKQKPIQKKVLESQIYLNTAEPSNSSNTSSTPLSSLNVTNTNVTNSTVNNKPESKLEIRRRMMPTQPNYSVHELAEYKTNSREIAHLFAHAEQALGKLLSPTDMSKIFSFHDWLGLPTDVIEYLLTYCTDNDKRSLKYIETCAIDWAERGIEDLVMALEYVHSFDNYNTVLRRLGLKNMTATSKKSFEKWTIEWQMPIALILNACDRAVENNIVKLGYVEGILKKWHAKGITTLEGVAKDDEEFADSKQLKLDTRKNTNKKNFANFQQRDDDLTPLEQQAWDIQMKKAQESREFHKKTWRERMAKDDSKLLKEG